MPIFKATQQLKQVPPQAFTKKASGVCHVCELANGLAEQIETLNALIDSKGIIIRQDQEILQMKNEEIGRLKREMAVLEQFKQEQ